MYFFYKLYLLVIIYKYEFNSKNNSFTDFNIDI